jgi:hypothetical protein
MPTINNNSDDTDFILKFLQDPRVDITMGDNAATKWAFERNNMAVAEYLLSNIEVTESVNFKILLKLACNDNNPEMVKMLIDDFDVDVSYRNCVRLRVVIRRNYYEVFKLLIGSPKFNLNGSIVDIFYSAIESDYNIYFDTLIKHKNLNFKNVDCDFINIAIMYNNNYILKQLLRNSDIMNNVDESTMVELIAKKFIPTYKSRKVSRV